jgi:N-acylglucosamine 2-epimerase
MKGLGMPMILFETARILRDTIGDPLAEEWVGRAAEQMKEFVDHERKAVLETLAEDGTVLDHFDGRTLNPGHALEAAWFLLAEARRRGGDPQLEELGATMLDYTWPRGWDDEHGGLLYFVDLDGKPVQEYWHDMKFWWPHNEGVLATLLAHLATGDPRYERWHRDVHEWAHARFADPEHGEWYGYLHRDGSVSVPLKGNMWKGPFHLPRMQLTAWRLLAAELDS